MADQQICHSALSLDDLVAFGSLRAGERVQWYNIVRELASRNLSVDSPSIGLLFRQAAWELGTWSASTDSRVAHQPVQIEMMRLRLRFFNAQGALQSREMSATVDRDQDIGCFYGLRNKLIVRDTKDHWHRSVVVPFGKVVAVKEKHNSIVHIEPSSESRRIGYFRYSLDRHLYVLRGTPDMQATLYQACLHAMTSLCVTRSSHTSIWNSRGSADLTAGSASVNPALEIEIVWIC
ncbi:hypothetical protein BO99DRAFT_191948 [Aspergillus violaceofuscus CBS 115571]|uniref:Uncharacterized protein n=1 Tax=Aspergillus violaceofuscus (strain CBS 115571) TaxID=1450538 RepID=A0A2V5H0X5_ASPV1|nr:hypothetical protein BO99DRAFT_191948 [Aspergillus violaceofuscus CBS 115571]